MNSIQVKHRGQYKTFVVSESWKQRIENCSQDNKEALYDELFNISQKNTDEVSLHSIAWE